MHPKTNLAVGVDAGSMFTRCVVCALEDGCVRYLGYGEVESAGWNKGRLSDQPALSECIRLAVQEAESRAQASVDQLVVGIGGPGIEGMNSRGLYEFGRPRQISQDEIAYAIEKASRGRLEQGRMLLQVLPQDFTLDGRAGYRYPLGSTCSRLEANVYLLSASAQEHELMISAAHQAHLAVEETMFEPLAAAYACILPEERSRGIALLDLGWHSTGLVVYDGDALLAAKPLPISADHFTRDVAFGLKVAYEDAERLKIEYGCAMLGLTADNSLIEVPSPEGRLPREAPRRQLNEILEARAEELFLFVRSELEQVGMEQGLLEGIVLTGGGALLNGMCDMAERVLNCPARNGLVVGIENWPDELHNPLWTTAAGLAMYSARLKFKREAKRKAPGLVGLVLK